MSGVIALHGGGEFQAGDDEFLAAWLRSAASRTDASATESGEGGDVLRVTIVPTAAARGRPDLVVAHGRAAIERVAAEIELAVEVDGVSVLDRRDADDPELAGRLATSQAIHLPGGDPDLIPTLLAGTATAAAIRDALDAGAALAGASAGAMGLATWTWTPGGGIPGLDLLPTPLAILPHADAASWHDARRRFGQGLPADLGVLGLGEQTGVLIELGRAAPWRVVGEGEVRWVEPGGDQAHPIVFRSGDSFEPGVGD